MTACSPRRLLPCALVLFLLASGCGDGEPALAPVRGRVYHKGVPLAGGSIVFAPDADKGGHGPLALAEIAADGSYSLRTGDEAGAVPGWHRVTVVAVEVSPAAEPGALAEARSLIAPKYAAPDLSGLTGQVKPGETNAIDFHLE